MSKRIALFMDGTWDSRNDRYLSNVALLSNAVRPTGEDGVPQYAQYQKGIGVSRFAVCRWFEGVTGLGLDQHVQHLYTYLVQNYEPGDRLYLVGFSRGAFTARCLAGLIRKSGILKPEHRDQVSAAYRQYLDISIHPDSDAAKGFRQGYAWDEFIDPTDFIIHFIGVFDTVGALGVPATWISTALMQLHDTTLSRFVHYAYQALAIDEHRREFAPCPWMPNLTTGPRPAGQEVIQAWFPGAHCDVGGGYRHAGLADCTLSWMADKVRRCGLDLDAAKFPDSKPRPAGTLHDSRTWLYWLRRAYFRPIDTPPSRQRVSRFAEERQRLVDSYDPKNLTEYIKRHTPVTYDPLPAGVETTGAVPPQSLSARGVAQLRHHLRMTVTGPQDDTNTPRPRASRPTVWNGKNFVPKP
ncbi:MAG: DUF2235 domain-containing protein [Acidiferrobacteraceae bacterium]